MTPSLFLDNSQELGESAEGIFNKFKCMNKKRASSEMTTLCELIIIIIYDIKAGRSKFSILLQLSKYISKSWTINFIFFKQRIASR